MALPCSELHGVMAQGGNDLISKGGKPFILYAEASKGGFGL